MARLHSTGFQAITDLSSAVSLTVPSQTVKALIIAEGQPVRWRDDGTAPTPTVGMLLPVNTPFLYEGDPKMIKFIGTTSGASLSVSYYV